MSQDANTTSILYLLNHIISIKINDSIFSHVVLTALFLARFFWVGIIKGPEPY